MNRLDGAPPTCSSSRQLNWDLLEGRSAPALLLSSLTRLSGCPAQQEVLRAHSFYRSCIFVSVTSEMLCWFLVWTWLPSTDLGPVQSAYHPGGLPVQNVPVPANQETATLGLPGSS